MSVLIRRETMLINPAAFIDQLAQAFLGRHESFIFIWEFSLNTKNEKSYYSLRLLCFIGMKLLQPVFGYTPLPCLVKGHLLITAWLSTYITVSLSFLPDVLPPAI